MNILKISIVLIAAILLVSSAYALTVDSVSVDQVSPGDEGEIEISVENDGERDVEFVSFNLAFLENQIIPIGSSSGFLDLLEENDDETFAFRFRVANNLPAGTYSVPYTLNYEENNNERTQTGTIGIVVSAEPEIEVIADVEDPIIGQTGRLNIRIVNKGLADARFVSLSVESEDITFLSEQSEYIGTIDSDDFEVSSFDVIYNNRRPQLSVTVEYKGFDNNDQRTITDLSLRAYTREEALELGLITRNNTSTYILVILALLILWYFWRRIRRNRRKKQKEKEAISR